MIRKWLSNNYLAILYKLFYDLLFLAMIFFFFALISENLAPGIVSVHVSFLKIIFFISLNIFLIYLIGSKLEYNLKLPPSKTIRKKTFVFYVLVFSALMFNSLYPHISLSFNFFLIGISILVGYWLYKIIFEEKNV